MIGKKATTDFADKAAKGTQNMTDSDSKDDSASYRVMRADEMRRQYGLVAENRPAITLRPEMVPKPLGHLITHAERWGVSDDLIREDMAMKATEDELRQLKEAVKACDAELTDWLAGPEASGPDYSPEYVAFSAMRMLVDGLP